MNTRLDIPRKGRRGVGGSAQSMLDIVRQQERETQIRMREELKLAGMIVIAAGIGVTIVLAVLYRTSLYG